MPSFAKRYESFDDFIRYITDDSLPTWKCARASEDKPIRS